MAELASCEDITGLRLRLRANGYRPVPIAGAHLGVKGAGKRPLMKAWETVCADADDVEITRWAKAQINCQNTGLLCGGLIGVDIDVLDDALAEKLAQLAMEKLGPTPLRRIGRAPKLLLAYRSAINFAKIQTAEIMMLEGPVARVEILATGQQFVAFGTHPETRAPYHWPDASPLEIRFDDLPAVDETACREYVRLAERMIRDAGGMTREEEKSRDRQGRIIAGLKQNGPPSRELIEEALAHVANDDLSYDSWIRVGLALYAALGSAGRDLWESWSAQSSKNEPVFTAGKWDSFAGVRSITAGTLFWLARQNGWRANVAQGNAGRGSSFATPSNVSGNGVAVSGDNDGRPVIRIRNGFLHVAVDQGEGALLQRGLEFYQRGNLVVRPTMTAIAVSGGREVRAQRLVNVKAHHMSEAFNKAASWMRFDKREGEWVKTDCSLRIAETYLAREGQWRLPVLTGVINCPTLRADGSILDQPGYDLRTGLLYDPQEGVFPLLSRAPERDEAMRALDFLLEVVATFPFVSDADRSVALSAILTTLIRRSLPTAPLHGFNAPTAGTGKSMLVDMASLVATGSLAAVIAQGKTEEEMEKRLGAALIAGDQLISIDNCESALGGELLCQCLTQQSLKVRILGKSINAETPCNAAMFATGNNLTLSGDMTRRALRCTLDAGVERPELRRFDQDPLALIAGNRGDYVAAALTVLLAFHAAGRPQQRDPLGSFVEWSRWVRDSLIWLGQADPCDTMEQLREADPKLEALMTVLEQWHSVVGFERVTVRELIEKATAQQQNYFGRNDFIHPEFRESLLAVAGDGGAVNGARLGKWIAANQNRIVHDRRIVSAGVSAGRQRWRVESLGRGDRASDHPVTNITKFLDKVTNASINYQT